MHLVFFPDDVHPMLNLWKQRPETQLAVVGSMDNLIQTEGIPHAPFDHKRAVEQEIIGGDDIELLFLSFQPTLQTAFFVFLAG